MKLNLHISFVGQWVFVVLILMSIHKPIYSQQEAEKDSVNRKRLNTVIIGSSAIYVTSMTTLYFLWYKDYPQSSFHFFNDNKEWLYMDKLGHITTSYYVSNYSYWSLRWTGLNEKKSVLYGSLMGFASMTVVEILDGYSKGWGASPGDILANAMGPALFASQQLLWHEQRLRLKVSYHPTEYTQYNPDLLGSNHLERIVKDYNGQTYLLSANIKSFLRKESRFPSWINVAVGYGAKGMMGANANPPDYNGVPIPHHNRVSQYYMSMDISWTRIKTNSAFLKFTFKALSFVKLPFPTLEYNKENQFVFHWFYF